MCGGRQALCGARRSRRSRLKPSAQASTSFALPHAAEPVTDDDAVPDEDDVEDSAAAAAAAAAKGPEEDSAGSSAFS